MPLSQLVRAVVCTVIAGGVVSIGEVYPAEPPLVVRDVNIGFISRSQINDRAAYRSTLPAVVLSQRPSPPKPSDAIPQPLGAITFEGSPSEDLDVLLEYDNSTRVLARWPHTEMRSTRTLWAKLKLAATPTAPSTAFPTNSWLMPLRNADRLTIEFSKRTEKFLLYDISIKSPTTIELEATDNGYKARNISSSVIHDVTVYRPLSNGKFRAAIAKELPGTGKEPTPAPKATPVARPAPLRKGVVAQAFQGLATAIGGQPAPAPAKPPVNGQPTVVPPSTPQHEIAWVGEEKTQEELIADWKPLLAAQGLGDAEIAHVQAILKERAFDKDSARVVFRLDPAAIEKLAPLEVSPQPDKVVRVWLMFYDGADPEIKTRIAQLIAELGDTSYQKRMNAKAQLLKLGPTAVPQLSAEKNNKDVEIAFRIEEILEELQSPSAARENPLNENEVIFN